MLILVFAYYPSLRIATNTKMIMAVFIYDILIFQFFIKALVA